jgi:hypothetical protein
VNDVVDQLRRRWWGYCETALQRAGKEPNSALPKIAAFYRSLDEAEQADVDELLIERLGRRSSAAAAPWYEAENARSLPEYLVGELRIRSALPALRSLAAWLETQETPGAPFEWAMVDRLIGRLVELPSNDAVRAVPEHIDGATVLQVADLSSAAPTGATRHVVHGREVASFAHLALAQYENDSGVYLFYCDADWNTVTDTYHDTLEAAVSQTEFEFGSVTFVPVA